MGRRKTHQMDVIMEVLALLRSKVEPGVEVTDEMWNKAYEIVWARAALEMIDWRLQNIDTVVLARFNHGK